MRDFIGTSISEFFNSIDVDRTLPARAVDVSIGRIAPLEGPPHERPESGRKAGVPLRARNGFRRLSETIATLAAPGSGRSIRLRLPFRHPCFAQAFVHPLVRLSRKPVLGLEVRLP